MIKTEKKSIQNYIDEHVASKKKFEGRLLNFETNDGFDVYNCSVPFDYDGKTYIWGRVERRSDWASSVTLLFVADGDKFVRAEGSECYPIEDPFFLKIGDEYVLGGVHVVKDKGKVKTYYTYFYRGTSPFNLKYFTTGPDYMKDIRLIPLSDGKIGVFSRPRNDEVKEKFGTVSQIGFTVIDNLDRLDADVIQNATLIPGVFASDEWGGVNQPILLSDGLIGLIGHQGYALFDGDFEYPIYVNTAYVYDPKANSLLMKKVIGVRSDYPYADPKNPHLIYCAFTSGITPAPNGNVYMYSGLGDSREGRIEIPDPFAAYR